MDFEKTVPFDGDFNKVAEVARKSLLPHGFQIVNTYDNSIELEGTRSFMSKEANPTIGVSWIHIQKTNNSLILKAEFKGLNKSIQVMKIVSISGSLIILAVLSQVFIRKDVSGQGLFIILALIPGFFIPLITPKIMKKNVAKTIDVLLNNMIASGKQI